MRVRARLAVGLVLIAACKANSRSSKAESSDVDESPRSSSGELREASMNFDLEQLEPFLNRVRGLVVGLSSSDVASVARGAAGMKVGQEREWTFEVTCDGVRVPLRVHVVMDDIDAPDLAIFTSGPLAARINGEMRAFAEQLGQ